MRQKTVTAILNVFSFNAGIFEIATASFAQKIKGTIAEKTIKIVAFLYRVTGEILTIMITEKPVTILHKNTALFQI
jgi:frataxin-like iron-binding protein CyaY